MVDIASKNHKSLLGISIQYVLNDVIVVRSIGMVQLNSSHTARYILQAMNNCLNLYGITHQQVISITTDNAANMILMTKLFDENTGQFLSYTI
jgi:hypothetical protein